MITTFPEEPFQQRKQNPLSEGMIASLLLLCKKQSQGITFDSQDINSSFTTLINRGLVMKKVKKIHGKKELIWEVTALAIAQLKALGFHIPC